jgi:predicted amidohydrolase YtcJ
MSYADLLFVNGQVVTVDANDSVAEALATVGERIVAVGTADEISGLKGPKTRVVDLGGRSLLPGIIDSHCHLVLYGLYKSGLDCRYPAVHSIGDITQLVRQASARTPRGEWIRGWAYDHTRLAEGRHPHREELDGVAPDHPVVLVRTDYHMSVANSRALELAGIGPATPDPQGGRIGRDENGLPNGLLVETAHMHLMKWAMPDRDELAGTLREASRSYQSLGITSAHDAGGFGPEQFATMAGLAGSDDLRLRIYSLVWSLVDVNEVLESFIGSGIGTGVGNEWFRIGHFKLMADGSSSGPTAAMREPYDSNPEESGILYYEQEEIDDLFSRAHRRGFQLTAHAQGDRAVDMVLTGMERATAGSAPASLRPRIEHCGIVDGQLVRRLKALNVVPVPQPVFFWDFGDGYLRDYGRRTEMQFASRSWIDQGVIAAASSDSPVTTPDPMRGIHAAITRRSRGGCVVGSNQRVTLREALRMHTINGAYASLEEGIKGSLEPGKLADLTVLSEPLHDLDVEAIPDVEAILTVVGGQVVFERD